MAEQPVSAYELRKKAAIAFADIAEALPFDRGFEHGESSPKELAELKAG